MCVKIFLCLLLAICAMMLVPQSSREQNPPTAYGCNVAQGQVQQGIRWQGLELFIANATNSYPAYAAMIPCAVWEMGIISS